MIKNHYMVKVWRNRILLSCSVKSDRQRFYKTNLYVNCSDIKSNFIGIKYQDSLGMQFLLDMIAFSEQPFVQTTVHGLLKIKLIEEVKLNERYELSWWLEADVFVPLINICFVLKDLTHNLLFMCFHA